MIVSRVSCGGSLSFVQYLALASKMTHTTFTYFGPFFVTIFRSFGGERPISSRVERALSALSSVSSDSTMECAVSALINWIKRSRGKYMDSALHRLKDAIKDAETNGDEARSLSLFYLLDRLLHRVWSDDGICKESLRRYLSKHLPRILYLIGASIPEGKEKKIRAMIRSWNDIPASSGSSGMESFLPRFGQGILKRRSKQRSNDEFGGGGGGDGDDLSSEGSIIDTDIEGSSPPLLINASPPSQPDADIGGDRPLGDGRATDSSGDSSSGSGGSNSAAMVGGSSRPDPRSWTNHQGASLCPDMLQRAVSGALLDVGVSPEGLSWRWNLDLVVGLLVRLKYYFNLWTKCDYAPDWECELIFIVLCSFISIFAYLTGIWLL